MRKLQAFPRTKGAIKEVEKISDRLKRVDIYFAIGYNIRNQRPAYSAGENGGRFMFEKVCNMLAEQLGISADIITPASEVVKDLGADSLDVVELMMARRGSGKPENSTGYRFHVGKTAKITQSESTFRARILRARFNIVQLGGSTCLRKNTALSQRLRSGRLRF